MWDTEHHSDKLRLLTSGTWFMEKLCFIRQIREDQHTFTSPKRSSTCYSYIFGINSFRFISISYTILYIYIFINCPRCGVRLQMTRTLLVAIFTMFRRNQNQPNTFSILKINMRQRKKIHNINICWYYFSIVSGICLFCVSNNFRVWFRLLF